MFAELHAVTIRDSVSFANAGSLFDATGALLEPGVAAAEAAMDLMLARLSWWAQALRAGRKTAPYALVTA